MMILISGYTGLIAFLEIEWWKLGETSHAKNLNLLHTTVGFVLSLLLAYRTNTAYDRWWEGRKQWGTLVNSCRNLAIKLSCFLSDQNDKLFFKKLIPTYAKVLSNHLMNEEVSLTLLEGLNLEIDHHKHKPNQVASIIYHKTSQLHIQGKLSGEQLIILNNELQSFTEICGACERIKNTPIPYSYNAFIKKFIFFFVMTLPFGFAFSLGYFAIPVVVFIFYVLASLELIAEEIEDPFGGDANDLPLHQISNNIDKHINELL